MTNKSKTGHRIRARSHLLKLLGDELIGDDRLAIFELVKNGYDADANEVDVTLSLAGKNPSIVVQDSGSGMTLDDLTGKWLELATDSRRKEPDKRSRRFHRLPLGEKGVGRIAVYKLGRYVHVVTRSKGQPEYEVTIDWDVLVAEGDYLEDLRVDIKGRPAPRTFPGASTGTRISITGLRRDEWTRGDVRKLYRLVTSLASPFRTPDRFKVVFSVPGRESEIADMLRPDDFLKNAIWTFKFDLTLENYSWEYGFSPPHWRQVKPRERSSKKDKLPLIPRDRDAKQRSPADKNKLFLSPGHLKGIGPISGYIYAYYRRAEVLSATGSVTQVREWLDEQTGVRVYRDGVRVFNYGEPSDDWLGLNVRRINRPGEKLGTNSVVAAIHLDLSQSKGLREKTNREGFDHNETYERLQWVVSSIFDHFERLHAEDRVALDHVIKGENVHKPLRFVDAVQHLREGVKEKKLAKEFSTDIDAIEKEFNELRDVMANAGTAGLNLAVIFHEIERGIDALAAAVKRGAEPTQVRNEIENLYQLLHGFAPLLRKNPSRLMFASEIVSAAVGIRAPRFKFHHVVLSTPLLDKKEADFRIRGPANLLTGCLGNLLDNALYWARFRQEKDQRKEPPAVRVVAAWDERSGSGLIGVVDNGPGFSIPPEEAVKAFRSMRPGGMGLGLYFAQQVMDQIGGALTIEAASELAEEIDIPPSYDGAAVVMRFTKG